MHQKHTPALPHLRLVAVLALMSLSAVAWGEAPATAPASSGWGACPLPPDASAGRCPSADDDGPDWFALGDELAERGVEISVGLTQVYQVNTHGGLSTHRRSGRYAGSYDVEMNLDMETLVGVPHAGVYVLVEGGWSEGIDASSVASLFGVNDDAAGNRSADVTELWWAQGLADGRVQIKLGKIDLTGGFECRGCPASFDGNAFANDETAQFLNGALVNNPSIPLPDNGLGAVVYFEPVDAWYLSIGGADARADARETGFNTAFHGRDDFFGIFETGLMPSLPGPNGPMQGGYRVGMWYDPQPKERFEDAREKRDDVGFYASLDQVVYRESAEDDQGLGVFARYGYAHEEVNEIRCFWSVGCQYRGLVPTRDEDVTGFGVAQGRLSEDAGFSAVHETAMEWYYNARLLPWLAMSPSVQYVMNPGGDDTVGDAVVVGARLQIVF